MCGHKCRCQKCYEMHGSGPMVTNKMTTTDTPRTDAFFNRTDIEWDDEVLFARQLERELLTARNDAFNLANALSKAEAEVEGLKELLSLEKNGHEGTKKICDKILDSTRKTPSRAWHRANKKIPLK